jgi:hypothetical protein
VNAVSASSGTVGSRFTTGLRSRIFGCKSNRRKTSTIYHITFYFVEEGPGRGSEDIKKECNVNCFDFFFFSVFLVDVR